MKIQKSKRVYSDTEVATEAEDLLFETDDVAELITEITGEDVDVEADGTTVIFDVGEESYTCEADPESADVVEESTKVRGRRSRKVSASTNRRRPGRTVSKRTR